MPINLTDFVIPGALNRAYQYASNQTTFQQFTKNLGLPFSFFLLLLCIAYSVLVFIIAVTYDSIFKAKQAKGRNVSRAIFGSHNDPCCSCCLSLAETCNCCRITSINTCLNGICPQRQSHDFSELILCTICNKRSDHIKGCCPIIECPTCCRSEYCEDATFCCFHCDFKERPLLKEQMNIIL